MNLQRNRLEGTKYKQQDQMELDGKGIPKKGEFDAVYKYPISNPTPFDPVVYIWFLPNDYVADSWHRGGLIFDRLYEEGQRTHHHI